MIFSWKIAVGTFDGELEYITPEEMHECRRNGDGTTEWRGHCEYGADFCVRVSVAPCCERMKGHLSIEGFNGRKFIEQIRFPVLTVPYTDDAKLMNGAMDLGLLINDPWLLHDKVDNEFSCASTTLFALLYPDGKGIYLDCRDGDYSPKKVILRPDRAAGSAEFSMVFYTGNGIEPFTAWEMPGSCVFGDFSGGWFEAAQIYKEYAVTRREFVARNRENPLRGIGLWIWNRGDVAEVVPPLVELQKELPDIPLALDWYWWHHNPYDTNYPFFWPPREGEETFRAAVSELRSKGFFVQVYLNGVCWDMDDASFSECGKNDAVLNRDGTVRNNVFNRYTKHRLAWMCPCTQKFHGLLAEQVAKLRECGLSGQYLDMIGAFGNVPCYSLEHGHPRGASGMLVEGHRNFLLRLKEENPDYPLSSEGCNEAFMDLLDSSIVCNTVSVEHFGGSNDVIPVFPAIYHGRNAMALYGNYALPAGVPPWDPLWPPEDRWKEEKPWHLLYPEQFFIDVMRNVVFGTQPMVCNLTSRIHDDAQYSHIWRFIVETARFYHGNIEFLFDGQMLNPDGFECGTRDVTFMQRMIFTRPEDFKTVTRRMPSLLHGIWQAPDGRKALFIGNYNAEEEHWKYGALSGTVAGHSYKRIDL